MDDLIRRQEVLNLLIRCAVPENGGGLLYQSIKQLPSTERHGHWTLIDKGHNFYDWECSICGGSGRGDYLFCPYCGAVMDEDIPIEYFENGGI